MIRVHAANWENMNSRRLTPQYPILNACKIKGFIWLKLLRPAKNPVIQGFYAERTAPTSCAICADNSAAEENFLSARSLSPNSNSNSAP